MRCRPLAFGCSAPAGAGTAPGCVAGAEPTVVEPPGLAEPPSGLLLDEPSKPGTLPSGRQAERGEAVAVLLGLPLPCPGLPPAGGCGNPLPRPPTGIPGMPVSPPPVVKSCGNSVELMYVKVPGCGSSTLRA